MKVNYFLATWSGPRRAGHMNGELLTHIHLQKLKNIDQKLSQITIGHPHNYRESKKYTEWMKNLNGSEINGTPVVVENITNEGYSYGQYSKMFDRHDDFDYYILTEDDYVPVKNNFDLKLVDFYKRSECGFLCGLSTPVLAEGAEPWNHAAISWGITSKEVLKENKKTYGRVLFHGPDLAQVNFSWGFTSSGFKIEDVRKEYCVPFHGPDKTIKYYGDRKKPTLFEPVNLQCNFKWLV